MEHFAFDDRHPLVETAAIQVARHKNWTPYNANHYRKRQRQCETIPALKAKGPHKTDACGDNPQSGLRGDHNHAWLELAPRTARTVGRNAQVRIAACPANHFQERLAAAASGRAADDANAEPLADLRNQLAVGVLTD